MSQKMNHKEIENLVKLGAAINITNDPTPMESEKSYEKVAYSMGVYGSNGALFRGESGKLYAITRRNSILAQYG